MVLYENFTRYTEYDPNSVTTVGINSIDVVDLRRDGVAYVRQDYGTPEQFGDFTHDFSFNVSSIDLTGVVDLWVLANNPDNDTHQKCYDNKDGMGVYLWRDSSSIWLAMRVFELGAAQNSYAISLNTEYYCRAARAGTSLTLQIYSDSARTALLATITRTCDATLYRYIYGMMSRGVASASAKITARAQNYDLNLPWTNQTACELGGAYWWGGSCNESPRFPSDVLASGYLAQFQNIVVKGIHAISGDYRSINVNASGQVEVDVVSGAYVTVQSGIFVNVGTALSGLDIQVDISGDSVVVSSGVIDITGGAVSISGNVITMSGNMIETHIMSGEVTVEQKASDTINIGAFATPTAESGGTQLSSGAVHSVIIRNMSGNQDVFVGGSGNTTNPYSGYGYCLEMDEKLTIDVQNFSEISLCANISGQLVTYMGTDY